MFSENSSDDNYVGCFAETSSLSAYIFLSSGRFSVHTPLWTVITRILSLEKESNSLDWIDKSPNLKQYLKTINEDDFTGRVRSFFDRAEKFRAIEASTYTLSYGFQPQSKDEEKKETMRIALFESLGTDYDHI